MTDPVLSYQTRYPLDLLGTNSNNLVVSEVHALANGRNRAIAPTYGPFFNNSVVLVESSTNRTLIYNTHYKFVGLQSTPSMLTGLAISSVILVTDPNVLPDIKVTYQTIGGEFVFSAEVLVELVNTSLQAAPLVNWYDILDVPDTLEPTQHLHALGDSIGFEYAVSEIERVKQAIFWAQGPAYQSLLNLIEQQSNTTDTRFATLLSSILGAAVTNLSGLPTPTTYPLGGTLIGTYCVGTTQMGQYNDGGGGTYEAIIAVNSASCGWVASAPVGTLTSTYCAGTTKMGIFSDGHGGTYNAPVEINSVTCGYVSPANVVNGPLINISASTTPFAFAVDNDIIVTLSGFLPNTTYNVCLTATDINGNLGLLQSIASASSVSGVNNYGPTAVTTSQAPSKLITTDINGYANWTFVYDNNGALQPGAWSIGADATKVVGSTYTPIPVAVEQTLISIPTNPPTIVVTPGSVGNSINYSLSGFTPNTTVSAIVHWQYQTNTGPAIQTNTINIVIGSSGIGSGTYTNPPSTSKYSAWITVLTSYDSSVVSNVYNYGLTNANALLIVLNQTPAVVDTAVLNYVFNGLTPTTTYVLKSTVTDPAFGVSNVLFNSSVSKTFTTDIHGSASVANFYNIPNATLNGIYTFGMSLFLSDGATPAPGVVYTNNGIYSLVAGTGTAPSIQLIATAPNDGVLPSSGQPNYTMRVMNGDNIIFGVSYVNLQPYTAYNLLVSGFFGESTVSFVTTANTSDTIPNMINVLAIDPGTTPPALGITPFINATLEVLNIASPTVQVTFTTPNLSVASDISLVASGQTVNVTYTGSNFSPNTIYSCQFLLENVQGSTYIAPAANVSGTTNSFGNMTFTFSFTPDTHPSTGNIVAGVYNIGMTVISPNSSYVSSTTLNTITINTLQLAIQAPIGVGLTGYIDTTNPH